MPGESLDAPENLPKQTPRQVALGPLEDKVLRMLDGTPVAAGTLFEDGIPSGRRPHDEPRT